VTRVLIHLLRLVARIPLRWFQAAGAFLGWVAYLASPRYSRRLRENLRASGVCTSDAEFQRILRANIAETGKQAIEFIPLWFRPQAHVAALVRECIGEERVKESTRSDRPIILLTPHRGCFEVSAIYAAQHIPITVLYRRPHVRWLDHLIRAGRARGQEKLAPADVGGVRMLLRALRQKEAVGVLPDQVPGAGDGRWTEFFGRPAYTMTLIGRLSQVGNPAVFVAIVHRLSRGAGFRIEVEPLEGDLTGPEGARRLNAAIEAAVRKCPEQYLWGYNRYKHPAGAPLPPTS